jgi:hypothetical protein
MQPAVVRASPSNIRGKKALLKLILMTRCPEDELERQLDEHSRYSATTLFRCEPSIPPLREVSIKAEPSTYNAIFRVDPYLNTPRGIALQFPCQGLNRIIIAWRLCSKGPVNLWFRAFFFSGEKRRKKAARAIQRRTAKFTRPVEKRCYKLRECHANLCGPMQPSQMPSSVSASLHSYLGQNRLNQKLTAPVSSGPSFKASSSVMISAPVHAGWNKA